MVKVYQTKREYRCTWLKVYHQNIDVGTFDNESEALYSIKEGKFSILGLINDEYKIDGKFEFMLELPDLTQRKGKNRWAQTDNPLKIQQSMYDNVLGYEPITMSWESGYNENGARFSFCGLARSDRPENALIDGACYPTAWYFAVAVFQKNYGNYIPGDSNYGKETILWMRVEDFKTHERRKSSHSLLLMVIELTEVIL